MKTHLAAVVLLLGLLVSCTHRGSLLPPSGGRLYEVLLVGDRGGIVADALSTDVDGLPQAEPQFDVSSIDSARFNASVQSARNIVMVHVSPTSYSRVSLRREKNVWAEPQTVVHVGAPSVKMLRDSIGRIAPALLRLLNRSELNKNISLLEHKRNTRAEQLIRRQFGIDVWIPVDMTASKQGSDFIWLSNNSPTVMKNIVVYKNWAPVTTSDGRSCYYSEEPSRFVAARDYMLGLNIKGETDAMHMATVKNTVDVNYDFKSERDRQRFLQRDTTVTPFFIYRGLWEMTGDDMGGPFVSRRIPLKRYERRQSLVCSDIVIEGFVFAPGKPKRNAVRQLEAVLYTAKYTR